MVPPLVEIPGSATDCRDGFLNLVGLLCTQLQRQSFEFCETQIKHTLFF